MPKLLIDYSKTIMYKIVCKDLSITDVYVGHTTNFVKRKNNHKTVCNNIYNKSYHFKLYEFIRENGDWDNFNMIEIEKYPCIDGNEASSRERYWYEQLNATLNKCIPCRNKNEYYKDNKDKILDYKKDYYQTNKHKKLEYYQTNKEKILEKKKEKYQTNKDKKLNQECNN